MRLVLRHSAAIGAALALLTCSASAWASVEAGETLFKARGCAGCHKVNGQGGAIGPDLSNEAAKGHDREWHIKHFLDPSGVTPGSMMPRLVKTREEAGDLADYVMSLGAAEAAPAPEAPAPAPEEKTEAAPAAPARRRPWSRPPRPRPRPPPRPRRHRSRPPSAGRPCSKRRGARGATASGARAAPSGRT